MFSFVTFTTHRQLLQEKTKQIEEEREAKRRQEAEAEAVDLELHALAQPIARHVVDRRRIAVMQVDADDAHRRLEAMPTRRESPEMGERHRRADRRVAAHAEIAGVVEEDQAGGAGGSVTSAEREELARLRRENKDLKRSNEILKAASVFFAKELDQPRTK